MIKAAQNSPGMVVHVDLDGTSEIYNQHGWSYEFSDDPLFESGMRNLLDFLDSNHLRGTLFAVASHVRDPAKRELLKEAAARGHEIASHSLTHPQFDQLTREQKRVEIAESRELLERELGVTVQGFRTPNYQVDRECLELLADYQYAYDSSVFPTVGFARRLGVADLPQQPCRPLDDRSLVELPLPNYRPGPFPFSPSYSLILGAPYFRWGLRRHRKTGQPLVLLFHLNDFSTPLPADRLCGWRSKLFTISHLDERVKFARCQAMLDTVTESFQATDTTSLCEEHEPKAQKQPTLLAISTTHETGAAVLTGSEVKAAISEERLDRVKFSTAYPPTKSIDEAIRISGIDPGEIDDVVISGLPASKLMSRLAGGQMRDILEFHGFIDYFPHFAKALYRAFYLYRAARYGSVRSYLRKRYGITPRVQFVEHHLCHAAAAYRTAPFDDALIVTADGVGDDLSLTISAGRQGKLERIHEIPYPHSFGQFYTACTQLLGFRGGRHEGKITGLSGYGKVEPEVYDKIKSTIRNSGRDFTLDKRYYSEGIVRGFSFKKLQKGESLFDALQYRNYKSPLKKLLKDYTREQVAAVFQQLLEEEVAAVVEPFAKETGLRNLALCGGVFANVKLNTDLVRRLGMEQVYVFPGMGDGGLSVGAGLEFLQAPPQPFNNVYWGPDYTDEQLEVPLKAAAAMGLTYRREENIEAKIAELLTQNKVIARFNGRMEFGPRALGNRSILYSTTDFGANDWLNKRLGRTEFMPFAPIVMADKGHEVFEGVSGKEHACKFMTVIVDCTEWTKQHCPAIVHVDGTARPQFVSKDINHSMYRILEEYEARTGIPMLVNTSFNMHEEPIVCSPEDAVRAYLASRLDYLALGPFLATLPKQED